MLSEPDQVNSRSQDLVDKAQTNTVDTLDGISAMEPEDFVHWSDRFYIMPVLDFVERDSSNGTNVGTTREPILVKTAAIPVDETKGTANGTCNAETTLGVVFVVDTTLSMQPYIDRTRKMMEELTIKLQGSKVVDRLSFGLVGYRDKPALNQDVKYRSQIFQSLNPNNDPNVFVSQLQKVSAADQSTKGFSEDGLIGVLTAAEMDWDQYQMRWIILVTDAGVRDPTVDDSGTKWGLQAVANKLWNEKHIGLMALHLATPDAKAKGNVTGAQRQLEHLSRWATTTSAYVRIEDGDIGAFGTVIDTRVDEVIKQLQLTTAQLQQQAAQGNAVAEIGLAQKLIWLGACNGTNAPDTIEGWIVDKALGTPAAHSGNRYAFEPRILLTRVQMNELAKTLASIVETAKSTLGTPENFFGELALALGVAVSDANLINSNVVQGRLAEPVSAINKIGDVLPGYLARLPYRSDFLTLDRSAWANMAPQQIRPWILRVEAAIDTLRVHYNKQEKELFKLHPAATPGEWVYPVLLSDLP